MSVQALGTEGVWLTVEVTDDRLRGLYLRHYSAKKNRMAGRPIENLSQLRICGPGEPLSLLTPSADSGFNWLRSEYPQAGQIGVQCTFFRNESGRGCRNQGHTHCSSRQVFEADQVAWARWPGERHFTFVDPANVSANPGYCFKRAGWVNCGTTVGGLIILERLP